MDGACSVQRGWKCLVFVAELLFYEVVLGIYSKHIAFCVKKDKVALPDYIIFISCNFYSRSRELTRKMPFEDDEIDSLFPLLGDLEVISNGSIANGNCNGQRARYESQSSEECGEF